MPALSTKIWTWLTNYRFYRFVTVYCSGFTVTEFDIYTQHVKN